MKPVFEAVVHGNPYPSEMFAEDDWNQMVVKADFIESPLWPIQGLVLRRNPCLPPMPAARGRTACREPADQPEVWRCIAPYIDAEATAAVTMPGMPASRTTGSPSRSPCRPRLCLDSRQPIAERQIRRRIVRKIGWQDIV